MKRSVVFSIERTGHCGVCASTPGPWLIPNIRAPSDWLSSNARALNFLALIGPRVTTTIVCIVYLSTSTTNFLLQDSVCLPLTCHSMNCASLLHWQLPSEANNCHRQNNGRPHLLKSWQSAHYTPACTSRCRW